MLSIENLTKKHGDTTILNDLSVSIPHGQIVVLIGPSGSGKSTILRCIKGLDTYEGGSIRILDKKGQKIDISRIGMVFQHFYLFKNMTALQNLIYAPINVLKLNKDEAVQRAEKFLEVVGLSHLKNSYPTRMSGGQMQRIAIARALCMEPTMILFDEPTSALDPENVKEVTSVIQSLATRGITMLIVTHAMKFASSIAERILFLDHGKIIEDAKSNIFFKNPKTQRAQEFLSLVI